METVLEVLHDAGTATVQKQGLLLEDDLLDISPIRSPDECHTWPGHLKEISNNKRNHSQGLLGEVHARLVSAGDETTPIVINACCARPAAQNCMASCWPQSASSSRDSGPSFSKKEEDETRNMPQKTLQDIRRDVGASSASINNASNPGGTTPGRMGDTRTNA